MLKKTNVTALKQIEIPEFAIKLMHKLCPTHMSTEFWPEPLWDGGCKKSLLWEREWAEEREGAEGGIEGRKEVGLKEKQNLHLR